jgi:glucosylceramidase
MIAGSQTSRQTARSSAPIQWFQIFATHPDYMALYFYLAHFSKFVRPGAVLLTTTTGAMSNVWALPFQAPEGGTVLQLLNSRVEPVPVSVLWRGRLLKADLPALFISTYRWPA